LIKKLFFIFNIFFIYISFSSICSANLKDDLINKITATKTLSFNFVQIISGTEETGDCIIKYPLKMKCNYQNLKQKIIISNGKKVSIIKKKYKKIYSYPIKSTPLFFLLKKEKIISLIRKSNPVELNSEIVAFAFIDKRKNIVKIFFDKNSLNLKGWNTKDNYSNDVNFIINNSRINDQVSDDIFKIPNEEDL